MGDDRNHFKFLNKITAKISSLLERIRIASAAFYFALQIIFFLLLAIATYFIEQACDKGWTVILLLALFGILFFLAVFAFDYANAKRINHQFFWKPWILILILILYIMFLGLRIGGQRTENARQLQDTNDFFNDIARNLTNTIEATNSYYISKIGKLRDSISELNGELTDAKQDRNHYQEMLAPFEAMAIAKYTNAPMDQRLDLLTESMDSFTNILNEIQSEKPKLQLRINGIILPYVDNSPGAVVTGTQISIKKTDAISITISNSSVNTASHIVIDFLAPIDPTNIEAVGWSQQPSNGIGNHWDTMSDFSTAQYESFLASPLKISPNFKAQYLYAQIIYHAENSHAFKAAATFVFVDK